MKKFIVILLILPFISYSNNHLLLSKNKYSLMYGTNALNNVLTKTSPPKKKSGEGLKISDVPWLVSGGMIIVGGAIAIYYGYNQQNKPGLAITGGGIAIAGGVLATIRVFTLSRGGKLFGMVDAPHTSVAIHPMGVKITHQF